MMNIYEKLKLRRKKDVITPNAVFQREDEIRSFATSADGRLIGIRVPKDQIHKEDYNLHPDRYIKTREIERKIEPPATLSQRFARISLN